MAFAKKTWKDRLVEFAGRRNLTRVAGSVDGTLVVDVSRNEGTVSQAGDAFSAANMNDLEQRIADEFSEQPEWILNETGKITGYKTSAGADTVFPFSDIGTMHVINFTSAKDVKLGTRVFDTPGRPKIICAVITYYQYGLNHGDDGQGCTFWADKSIVGVDASNGVMMGRGVAISDISDSSFSISASYPANGKVRYWV